jgi:hypothetical protein
LYLLLLLALINYNYVVEYAPKLKNLYVAIAGTLPIFILASLLPDLPGVARTSSALLLILFGREVLMDVQDHSGDGPTLAKSMGLARATSLGMASISIGSIVLLLAPSAPAALLCALLAMLLTVVLIGVWFLVPRLRRLVINAMKAQLLLGVAYLALQ